MDKDTINILCKQFELNEEVVRFVNSKERLIINKFNGIDRIKEYNQYKVINSMQEVRLSSTDFSWSTGYGYGDVGRDKVEQIYSMVFNAEDALVRPTIASGTHAITLTLSGLLRPNDEFVSITGSPYDTLQKVIGVKGSQKGTLFDYGIKYKEIPLKDGDINIEEVLNNISRNNKLLLIQRSTGYSDRRAVTIDEMNSLAGKLDEGD